MGRIKSGTSQNTAPPPAVQPSRLNVGCGNDILKGYINLDSAELPGVDIVHDLTMFPWPFDDDRFEEIRMVEVKLNAIKK